MPIKNPITLEEISLSSSGEERTNKSKSPDKSKKVLPYFDLADEMQKDNTHDKSEITEDDIELVDMQENEEYNRQTKVKIGMGMYSVVYKIQQTHTNKWVAIKEVDDQSVENEAQIFEVLTEKKKQASLNAKYVLDFLGKTALQGKSYLVMEYAPQGNLGQFIINFKQIPWTNWDAYWQISYPIVIQCLQGMQFIHGVGWAHRDIKPDNILLTHEFQPKICDFGLSAKLGSQAEPVGTPLYCAPEILELRQRHEEAKGQNKTLQSELKVSVVADYFSLGVTLWELAAREEPYEDTLNGLYENRVIKSERYDIPEKCPVKVSTLIDALWRQDPAKREIPGSLDGDEKSILLAPK